jgi:hypothetical protein
VLLGLEPRSGTVHVDPALPAAVTQLSLYWVHGPGGVFDAVAGDVPVAA